jgi:hypothetical protein
LFLKTEQIRHIQRHLLFDLNNRGEHLEEMEDDDEDWDDAEVGKIFKKTSIELTLIVCLLSSIYQQIALFI